MATDTMPGTTVEAATLLWNGRITVGVPAAEVEAAVLTIFLAAMIPPSADLVTATPFHLLAMLPNIAVTAHGILDHGLSLVLIDSHPGLRFYWPTVDEFMNDTSDDLNDLDPRG